MRIRISNISKSSVLTGVFIALVQLTSFAQPCFTGYQFRVPIVITNSAAALSNFQIKIALNTATLVSAGKMNSTGKDIRILDGKGNELNYWIEDGTINTASTQLWIKTNVINGYGTDTVYLFYGNTTASAKSDAGLTFDAFDDFNGSSLSSSWSTCGSGSSTVTGGKLILNASGNYIQVKSTNTSSVPTIMEASISGFSNGKFVIGALNSSGNGYATGLVSGSRTIESVSNASCYTTGVLNTTSTSSSTGLTGFMWISTGSQAATWSSGNVSATSTTYSLPSSVAHFVGLNGTGSVDIDFIRVRKYSANLPSTSLLSEVKLNFTISPNYKAPLCEDGTLELTVASITGATYKWTGPNSFLSYLQNPKITGVSTADAGRYDLTVSIPSGCASQSSSVNVNISPKARGGTVSGTQTVCAGSNSGVLSLSGHTGNVSRWDSATNSTGPWYPISNTQLNQNYLNVSTSTFYRAIVSNGNCSVDSSIAAKLTVTPPSDGGSLSGSTQVCTGSNSGVISLSGYLGVIVRWEYSENGNLWYSIVNKGTSHAYSNLTKTIYYRAVVQNGNCNVAYSSIAQVQVDQASVGGTISGAKTVCPDDNTGYVILGGKTGKVIRWESKPTSGYTWQNIALTSDTLKYNNLGESTSYRAVVQNGSCSAVESGSATITVFSKSSAGVLVGGTTVCEGSNAGTLTLNGVSGSILKWQKRVDKTNWTDFANTSNTFAWYNLTDTTAYRAIVANSGCKADTSNAQTIVVDAESVNGYLTGTEDVCVSGNKVELRLNGFRGQIEKWETSETGYSPWTSITSTSSAFSENNLAKTKYYRVTVKNGVCPKAITTNFMVKVDPVTVAGKAGPDIAICEGTNFGVITLTGLVGDVLKWQTTSDLTSGNWTDINNRTVKQEFQNISETKHYRAIVQSGTCATDTSNRASVTVSKYTVAGSLVGEAGYCTGINNGQIKLVGYAGDIQNWESSINGGDQWTILTTNQNTLNYTDLNISTLYRAVVKSGACGQLTSNSVQIEIAKPSWAGELSSTNNTLCKGANFGTVNASDVVGNILFWEFQENGGPWQSIKNTTPQQSFFNLTEATNYRSIAQNRFCIADTSKIYAFGISQPTDGGEITGVSQVCANEPKVTLTLTKHEGSVIHWQSSTNSNGPWTIESSKSTTFDILNPSTSKYYRAQLVSGVCQAQYSKVFPLTVFDKTVGGSTIGSSEVCAGNNSGVIGLSGKIGEIVRWESRPLGGSMWTDIMNTSNALGFVNIANSTEYRAVIRNGVCAMANSTPTTILTNPNPVVNMAHDNLCDGKIIKFNQKASISTGSITSYKWSFSDGFTSNLDQFDKSFLIPGKYSVVLNAESDKGCTTAHKQDIVVGESPMVYFRVLKGLSPSTGCLNQIAKLENVTSHSDLTSLDFRWNFGNGTTSNLSNPEIKYTAAGTYRIQLTAASRTGCSDSFDAEYVIFEENKPIAGRDVVASKGIGTQLNARGCIAYSWTPTDVLDDAKIPNPIARITESTTFIVSGIDYFGCTSSDTILVNVSEDYKVTANNIITPDGNGGNDVWIIKNLENYPDNMVFVYDRWGREVFKQQGYTNDWGATDANGNILMDGTYYYVLEFPNVNKVEKGAITVIKNH